MKALKALFHGKINKSFTHNVYLWLAFSMIIYLLFFNKRVSSLFRGWFYFNGTERILKFLCCEIVATESEHILIIAIFVSSVPTVS
jgi:hypothetical protein